MKKGSLIKMTFVTGLSLGVSVFGAGSAAASLLASFTNNGVAAADLAAGSTDNLVLDVTLPDAFNGVASTEDIVVAQGSNPIWQGDTLNAIPALGAIDGVGYTNVAPNGFQGLGAGEAVVIDHDNDGKYTNAADTLLDADGSTTDGVGTIDAAATAGDPLTKITDGTTVVTGGFALCTNNRNNPTAIRIDTDSDCTNGTKTEGTYILGTNATIAKTNANDKWSWGDDASMGGNGNGTYDEGEDLFKESRKNALTYSDKADTDVYNVGGINNGKVLKDFPADCDKGGVGTQPCFFTGTAPIDAADSIVIDEGNAGGAAPNNVVDKQVDQLTGLAVLNTETATSEDISELKLWAENGANAGFLATEDTLLGTMVPEGTTTKHWRLGSLTQAISAGGVRIYITASISAGPNADRKIQLSIPVYADAGSDNVVTQATDMGVFVSSNNDGPTDTALVNPNIQTIKVPSKTNVNQNFGNSNLEFQEELSTDEGEEEEEKTTEEVTVEEEESTTEEEETTQQEEVVVEEEVTQEEQAPVEEVVVEDDEGEVLGLKVFGPGELIRGSDMRIWLINEDGTKHHVLNLEELAANHLGKTIHDVSNDILNSYPNEK